MSEQTPLMSDKAVAIGLAEMKAAHRFRNPCRERDGECWTCDILGAAIRALSHAEAAGASVPQEATVTRARLIAEYLQEYDRCVAGLTCLTAREYFEGALDLEILNRQANRPVSHG